MRTMKITQKEYAKTFNDWKVRTIRDMMRTKRLWKRWMTTTQYYKPN